jgi:uncharacterized MAPEG superfamily protein
MSCSSTRVGARVRGGCADNPLHLAHIPDKGGYEFDFSNPRNRVVEMTSTGQRAFNAVLHQGENYAFFAAAVLANVAVRGGMNGTQEVCVAPLPLWPRVATVQLEMLVAVVLGYGDVL